MKILHLSLSIILAFSLTGCWWDKEPEPECPVSTKIQYVPSLVPTLPKKPTSEVYSSKMMQINGVDYYVYDKHNAQIMGSNWMSYKNWSETNYKILLNLKKIADQNSTK